MKILKTRRPRRNHIRSIYDCSRGGAVGPTGRSDAFIAYPSAPSQGSATKDKSLFRAGTRAEARLQNHLLADFGLPPSAQYWWGNYENLERPNSAAKINTGEDANRKGNSTVGRIPDGLRHW